MVLLEIFDINEGFGPNRFPGYGQNLFSKGFYEFFASEIADVRDETLRLDLGEWMAKLFDKDSYNFDEGRFMSWIRDNKKGGRYYHGSGYPRLQQRHFFYFAEAIKNDPVPARREFLANWLGGILRKVNDRFKTDVWMKYCGFGEE